MMKGLNPEFVIPGHGHLAQSKYLMTLKNIMLCWWNGSARWQSEGKSLDEIKKK